MYEKILELYAEKYNYIKKDDRKEIFDDIYNRKNDDDNYDKLNHHDFLEEEKKLNSINVLNNIYNFENIFFMEDTYYKYNSNKYDSFASFLIGMLYLRLEYNIVINYDDNSHLEDEIISIIKDIKITEKIIQMFNLFNLISEGKFNNYKSYLCSINRIKIEFSFKYAEKIKEYLKKECLENTEIKKYKETFNYIIDFIDFTYNLKNNEINYPGYCYYHSYNNYDYYDYIKKEILEYNKSYDDYMKDFVIDDNDLSIIEEAKKDFIKPYYIRRDSYYFYKSDDENLNLEENKKNKLKFFENNYKLIYKIAKPFFNREKILWNI